MFLNNGNHLVCNVATESKAKCLLVSYCSLPGHLKQPDYVNNQIFPPAGRIKEAQQITTKPNPPEDGDGLPEKIKHKSGAHEYSSYRFDTGRSERDKIHCSDQEALNV